ncbi:Kae1-associated serine/threonine protein kinase [Candidatus Woesearchaeota archaeon]|nr:Kae1-associated serine/threonine protein kinase [Candidatus Woesearchaeota archaeon]
MELVAQGAEARIFKKGGVIVKERFAKSYRLPAIDAGIRASRTRREVKVMESLGKIGVNVPGVVSHSDFSIEMELVEGRLVRDLLNEPGNRVYCIEIGRSVGLMHSSNIIHSDLTTSNILLSGGRIFFIDFGLSFFSQKPEDKAVDIHLFRQALLGNEQCFSAFLEGYVDSYSGHKVVLDRLEKVEARGRHKAK